MDINLKDRRIISELDLNARATYQEIAKKARLSKESVIYRVNLLEKKGLIERYTTLVNFSKLGYTGYAVFSRLQNTNDKLKKEIITYLSKIPEIYWVALVGGRFDLVFGIMARNIFDFNKSYYGILNKFGDYLVENTIEIRSELRQHKRKYLIEENKPEIFNPPYFGKQPEIELLDRLDSDILSVLSINARISIVNLAEKLNKPTSTIALRIRKLEERGIIQGYSAYIRPQKYGFQSYRLLLYLQNMDEKARADLFAYVNSNKNAILAIETVGEWNFEITLELENVEKLQIEISKLRNFFKEIIKKIEFLVMFEDDLVYDPYPLKKAFRKK